MRTKWFWVAVVLLMTLSLALVTTALAVAPDIYVRTDGNDAECDGTADVAYPGGTGPLACAVQTIQQGINLIGPGGTVNVAAGVYAENLILANGVTLKGAQAGVAVSGRTAGDANEATLQGQITVNASDVEINGFTLTNPGQTNAVVVNNNTPSHSNIGLRYNFIDTVGSVSLTSNVHAVMVYRGPDNVTIEKNSFNNIKANDKSVSAVGVLDSVSTDASNGLLIQNNSFSDIASVTKGAYGVIINNAAGAPGAQIKDNSFSGLSGGWTHAIGLEGPTLDAVVTGNSFANLTSGGVDKAAIFFEKNPNGDTVTLQCNQFNGSTFYGVAIHPNDQPGGVNGYNYIVNAEENWWNAASGPGPVGPGTGAAVTPNVDYSPWYIDDTCTTTASEDPNGGITVPGGTDPALIQDILDDAPPGSEITFEDGGSYDGGLVVDTPGLTLNLNGSTGGAGSPFLTVNAANITLNGPGTLDGAGDPSPAILINAGGDNFILNGVEIKNWADGVEVAASVNSLKIVNNWFHDNADAGVQVNSGVTIGGVITIEGNLFKFNGGNGIQNDGAPAPLPAEYNSWGDIGGSASGDGVGGTGGVDASPFSFAEVWMDVDPNTSATQRDVIENDSFDVAVKVDAAGLYGVQYLVTYDPNLLTLNTTTDGAFVGTGSCTYNTGTPGVVSAYCSRQSPDADANGTITVSTLNFTADLPGILPGDDGPWTNLFDISTAAADLSASAQGSIKAWVNNGGFGADSGNTGRTITDANDGQIDIDGLANYTGYVDVQGRVNDGGATLTVYDQLAKVGSTALAQAASVSSGAYTTAYLGPNQLVVGNTYWLVFDRALYLPTTAVAAVNYDDSKLLSDRPTTALGMLVLLGGDANDDNVIDIADAGCIGFDYGTNVSTCATGSSDVNGDGTINLLDLTLMGGNYGKTASPWTP